MREYGTRSSHTDYRKSTIETSEWENHTLISIIVGILCFLSFLSKKQKKIKIKMYYLLTLVLLY